MNLIFDFDQTLGYRDGMWSSVIFEILQESGYSNVEYNSIRLYTKIGFPWNDYHVSHNKLFNGLSWWEYMEVIVTRVLLNFGINDNEAKVLSKKVRNKYLDLSKWHLFDETYDVLESLTSLDYNCYILSNHVPELSAITNHLGIDKFIKKIFNSADIGYEKPNSKIYQYVIKDLNVPLESIIMVGDNYIADVVGARSNGINAVFVRAENKFDYKFYCKDLLSLKNVIEKIRFSVNF
jgi:putative hydrolase of the HAD superfamily